MWQNYLAISCEENYLSISCTTGSFRHTCVNQITWGTMIGMISRIASRFPPGVISIFTWCGLNLHLVWSQRKDLSQQMQRRAPPPPPAPSRDRPVLSLTLHLWKIHIWNIFIWMPALLWALVTAWFDVWWQHSCHRSRQIKLVPQLIGDNNNVVQAWFDVRQWPVSHCVTQVCHTSYTSHSKPPLSDKSNRYYISRQLIGDNACAFTRFLTR